MSTPVNCPKCGAPITVRPDTEGYKCGYCHAVFFPDAGDDGVQVSAEQGSQNPACPLCSVALAQAAIAGSAVLYCTQCHGMLMPMNVLPRLVAALKADGRPAAVQTPPDHDDLKRVIQCPQCHRRMDTHFYAGPGNVILDSCGICLLLWLDRGEVTRIAHAPDEEEKDGSGW